MLPGHDIEFHGGTVFLTKRQSQLLDHLRHCIAVQGYAPSLEEIAAHFDLSSVGTVHKHLKALEEKGFIRRQWNRSRAIEIIDSPDGRARRVPIVGWLEGGHPIERMQTSQSVAVPEDLTGLEATVVLQVRGRSLRDECLDDGDYVVMARREQIRDGETVVLVLADGSTQVKLFQHSGGQVLLRSLSNGGAPISVPRADMRVEGVVVGILRRMNPLN
jgi:repressor LexA